jgi:indole-3-glycerol phosphate synthase
MRRVPDVLQRLISEAQAETEQRRKRVSMGDLQRRVRHGERDFASAIRRHDRLAVIGEMKSRTPSMGVLVSDGYSPARLARMYTEGGASALSVLCQQTSFGGEPEHLSLARSATNLPILRKDFIVDEYQVLEARCYDADAVLLIVAALSPTRLEELIRLARSLGMEALVEVHDRPEVDIALSSDARIIGVNHRDLRTFDVDLSLTDRLRPLIPHDRTMVAESGIHSVEDARRMRTAGADAILVGEALLRAPDPSSKLRELAAA